MRLQHLTHPDRWLLATASGLIALHLTLVSHSNRPEFFATSLVFWLAVLSLLWQKQPTLKLSSSPWASTIGAGLIGWLLVRSTAMHGFDPLLYLFPLLAAIGLGLLASGFRGLRQYRQELLALACLGLPAGSLSLLVELSPLTARFVTLLLLYLGFPVTRHETFITLPGSTIEVYPGCSGIHLILQLLQLAILYLILFPGDRRQRILIPLAAIVIGFLINAGRVALMAILLSGGHQAAFDYWHQGQGSLIFSMLAVLVFGGLCYQCIPALEAHE